MVFAETSLQVLPPFSAELALGLAGALVVLALVLRWLLGTANPVARRGAIWELRGAILGLIGLIFINPVRRSELPGPIQRPEMFYLLDTSASMQMGNPRSRWDESLGVIQQAQELARSSPAVIKPFRFGQRLAAIEQPAQIGLAPS